MKFNSDTHTHTLTLTETLFPMSQLLYNCILYREAPLWQIEFECKSIFTMSVGCNGSLLLNALRRNVVMFMGGFCAHFIDYFYVHHERHIRIKQFHCRNCMKSTLKMFELFFYWFIFLDKCMCAKLHFYLEACNLIRHS